MYPTFPSCFKLKYPLKVYLWVSRFTKPCHDLIFSIYNAFNNILICKMQRIIPDSFIKLLLKNELICVKILFMLEILYKCTFNYYYSNFVNCKPPKITSPLLFLSALILPTAILIKKITSSDCPL